MSPGAAKPRRKAPKSATPPTSPIVIQRTFAPDIQRQVEALLILLRARPNDDGKGRP